MLLYIIVQGGGGGGGEGEDVTSGAVAADEVMTFSCNCSNCQSPVETRMKLVGILLALQ